MFEQVSEDVVLESVKSGDEIMVTTEDTIRGVLVRRTVVRATVAYVEDDCVFDMDDRVIYDTTASHGLDSTVSLAVRPADDLSALRVGSVLTGVLTANQDTYDALLKQEGDQWIGMLGFTPTLVLSEDIMVWSLKRD